MATDYPASSPLTPIQRAVAMGYGTGNWLGTGLTSGAAAAAASGTNRTAIGIAEASDLFTSFPATFSGQSVDNTSVLLRYVYAGDADLSGMVETLDFNQLAV